MDFDYIVVGGGSAGSVLANRLSARGTNKVLVCEAGEDTPPGKEPPEVLDSYSGTAYLNNRFLWKDLKVSTEVVSHNNDPTAPKPRLRKYEQARVLGGGSSINGQMANRGAPTDYDEWHARGATGWKWADVLPYFKKLERDLDFNDEWHGQDGPIPVRRVPEVQWPGHAKALAKAFARAGYKALPDQNGYFEDGYFPVTISNANEQRVSASIGYLDAEVRKRPNLTISTHTQVTELLFDGLRCVGIKALVDGRSQEFRSKEVILSSGAIHSPAHLLRAGIGPAGHLADLGIPVRHASFGVGQRLMDHPSIALAAFVKKQARVTNKETRRHLFLGMRYSSQMGGAPPGDMFVVGATKTSWHAVGEQIGAFAHALPVVQRQVDAEAARDGNEVDDHVGRPPIAALARIAFSNAFFVRISRWRSSALPTGRCGAPRRAPARCAARPPPARRRCPACPGEGLPPWKPWWKRCPW